MGRAALSQPLLEITDLSVRLGGHLILKNLHLAVQAGTIHALLGPNGAGKTTLIRCLVGSLPHTGTIRFSFRGTGTIGYVPQLLEFDHALPITVADFFTLMLQKRPLFFGVKKKMRHTIQEQLQKTQSDHLIDRLIGSLSGGELRRVLLAQALIPKPEVLILDEPASNIDELGARAFEKTLQELRDQQKMTILMVAHDLATVIRSADYITGIKGGISYNGPAASLNDPAVLKQVFGVQAFGLDGHQEVIG